MYIDDIERAIAEETGVLLYFSGRDCGVCDALKPKVESLFGESFPMLKRYYVDAHEFPETAAHYRVFSVPTLIVFLEGKEFVREGRNMSLMALKEKLDRPYGILLS